MILERLKQYIDSKGITIAAFERSVGMSNASFGKSLKNGGSIGTDKLEKILTIYPDISPMWLLKGIGEMVYGDNTEFVENEKTENFQILKNNSSNILLNMIKEKDRVIREQAELIGRLKEKAKNTEEPFMESSSAILETDVGNVL